MPSRSKVIVAFLAGTIGLLAFVFGAQGAIAEEVWSGRDGSSDGNRLRQSKPASTLGVEWDTDPDVRSNWPDCISSGNGSVFTWVDDYDTSEKRLYAFDAGSGSVRWSTYEVAAYTDCPLIEDGRVLAAYMRLSDGRPVLASFDPVDGTRSWEYELPVGRGIDGMYSRALVYAGGTLIVKAVFGSTSELYAVDAETGNLSWSDTGMVTHWDLATASGSKVYLTGVSYPSRKGTLRAYSVADGTFVEWSAPTIGAQADFVSSDGIMVFRDVVTDMTGNRIGLEHIAMKAIDDDAVAWTSTVCGNWSQVTKLIDSSRVYSSCWFGPDGTSKIVALDRNTGRLEWAYPYETSVGNMFLLGGRIFAPGLIGEPWHIIDPATGRLVSRTEGYTSTDWGSSPKNAYADGRMFQWEGAIDGFPNDPPFMLSSRTDLFDPSVTLDGPERARYKSPNQIIAWTADDGVDNPIDHFEVRVNDQPVGTAVGDAVSFQLTGLAAGENDVQIRAIDPAGNQGTDSRQITIVPSPDPVADLAALPGPVLANAEVLLDASGSRDSVLDGSISSYRWDLDGDGSFETDGGSSASISTQLTQLGVRNVGVRVTNDSGNSASKYVSVDVRRKPLPGAGLVGVSINDAAIFTNDPVVKLKVSWPALASDLAVSNDGGFATSSNFPLPSNGIVEWTLSSSGPERLPKQVYVRYYGVGADSVTYSDDIILDQTAPVVQQVSLIGAVAGSSSLRALRSAASISKKPKKPRAYRVRLKARDATSGVVAVQFAKTPRVKGPVIGIARRSLRVNKIFSPRVKYRPKLVRVKDAAGNWSKFRKVK